MNVIAIDPGTANTGMVYMSEFAVIDCKTFHGPVVGFDQDALRERAGEVARAVLAFCAGRPHDAVVIEGFVGFAGRQSSYTYQTPYLCGYLHRALEHAGERVVIQTSRAVLNPRTRGSVVTEADRESGDAKRAALDRSGWDGVEKCGNDHLRAAALHGIYYYGREWR